MYRTQIAPSQEFSGVLVCIMDQSSFVPLPTMVSKVAGYVSHELPV